MKLLFLLLFPFASFSQVIDLKVYGYKETFVVEEDTFRVQSKVADDHYIFDITNKTMISFQTGKKSYFDIEVTKNEKGIVEFWIVDSNPSSGWTLDLNKSTSSYFEVRPTMDYYVKVTQSVFTKK